MCSLATAGEGGAGGGGGGGEAKAFDPSLLDILGCPLSKVACPALFHPRTAPAHGARAHQERLRFDAAKNELVSDSLGIAYPIDKKGWPILIPAAACHAVGDGKGATLRLRTRRARPQCTGNGRQQPARSLSSRETRRWHPCARRGASRRRLNWMVRSRRGRRWRRYRFAGSGGVSALPARARICSADHQRPPWQKSTRRRRSATTAAPPWCGSQRCGSGRPHVG